MFSNSSISALKLGKRKHEEIDDHFKKAFEILDTFMNNKSLHEESIQVLKDFNAGTETDVISVLAEHLLSKLAPEQSFIIDKKHRDNDKHNCCNCGCGAEINYGDTGIGHEEVWHGYLDIMVSSHEEVVPKTPAMTEPVAKKCKQASNIEENEEHSDKNDDSKDGKSNRYRKIESPGEKCVAVKIDLDESIDTEDQAIAQAIVFSLLQKSKHPDSKMFLIPTIVISREHFRILMYDAENDVLLRSQSLGLFVTRKSKELSPTCIVILWMVSLLSIFCSGLKKVGLNEDLQDLNVVKSGFREKLTPESIKLYDTYLKSNVRSFPTTERKGHDENPYIGFCSIYKQSHKFWLDMD